MRHRISAGTIVDEASRILLVRRVRPQRYDFWVAPGAGVKRNEELQAAVVREVREESGLEVEPLAVLYIEELLDPTNRRCKFWFW